MATDYVARSELKTFLINLANAFRSNDFDTLRCCYAEHPDIYWAGTDGEYAGLEAVHANLRTICDEGDDPDMRVDLSFRTHILIRDTIACIASPLNFYIRENSHPVVQKARFTATLEKIDGEWKILQQHVSVLPIQN